MSDEYKAEDKAGYNQAAGITEVLNQMRMAYISNKVDNKYSKSLELIRAILDIICGKLDENEEKKINEIIYKLEPQVYLAEQTYIDKDNGSFYFKYPQIRIKVKRDLEDLYRSVERLQNKYGYGMPSLDDPRLAVLQR